MTIDYPPSCLSNLFYSIKKWQTFYFWGKWSNYPSHSNHLTVETTMTNFDFCEIQCECEFEFEFESNLFELDWK